MEGSLLRCAAARVETSQCAGRDNVYRQRREEISPYQAAASQ